MKKLIIINCGKCDNEIPYKGSYYVGYDDLEVSLCDSCNDEWDELSYKCLSKLFKKWIKKCGDKPILSS